MSVGKSADWWSSPPSSLHRTDWHFSVQSRHSWVWVQPLCGNLGERTQQIRTILAACANIPETLQFVKSNETKWNQGQERQHLQFGNRTLFNLGWKESSQILLLCLGWKCGQTNHPYVAVGQSASEKRWREMAQRYRTYIIGMLTMVQYREVHFGGQCVLQLVGRTISKWEMLARNGVLSEVGIRRARNCYFVYCHQNNHHQHQQYAIAFILTSRILRCSINFSSPPWSMIIANRYFHVPQISPCISSWQHHEVFLFLEQISCWWKDWLEA